VIFAAGGSDPGRAAKAATTTIPIVFESAADPIAAGLVASLNRPGGNVTGVSLMGSALEAKRLELLHELAPKASAIAALVNPNYPAAKSQSEEFQAAAAHLGVKPIILTASTEDDIDLAFAILVQQGVGALVVCQDPFFGSRRQQLLALAVRHALPAIYQFREFPVEGGLISYGTDFADAYRQAGIYVGKVLKGTKPADLPVMQPTKFELVINLKTANALGLTVPLIMQMTADEVIE
jgi:putative tryptophan/tyrosine transport system substrate-binding protein